MDGAGADLKIKSRSGSFKPPRCFGPLEYLGNWGEFWFYLLFALLLLELRALYQASPPYLELTTSTNLSFALPSLDLLLQTLTMSSCHTIELLPVKLGGVDVNAVLCNHGLDTMQVLGVALCHLAAATVKGGSLFKF